MGPLTVERVDATGSWCTITNGQRSYTVACGRLRPLPDSFLPNQQTANTAAGARRKAPRDEPIPADLTCDVCGSDVDDAAMLVCNGCIRGYHLWCLDPPLQTVPKGDWKGPCCSAGDPPACRAAGNTQVRYIEDLGGCPAAPQGGRAAGGSAGMAHPAPQATLFMHSADTPSDLYSDQVVPELSDDQRPPLQGPGRGEQPAVTPLDSAGRGDPADPPEGDGTLQCPPSTRAEALADEAAEEPGEDDEGPLDTTLDQPVLTYLDSRTLPDSPSPGEKKRIRSRASGFFYQDDRLYNKPSKRYGPRKVPAIADRAELVRQAHDQLGHAGEQRTRHLLRQYWWRGMVQQVKEYVRSCTACQDAKPRFERQDTLNPIKMPKDGPAFSRIGIDLLGPFPKSSNGSVYAVICVEYSTRFGAAGALPDKRSETVAAWMAQYIGTHSVPKIIMSDRGTEFTGEAFQALCEGCLVDHRLSSAFTPNVNGLVEKFNDTVGRALRRACGRDPTPWHEELPFIVLGYNSTIQTSTKDSPFRLLHGREPSLPLHNVLPEPRPSGSTDLTLSDQEIEQREQQQRTLNLQARENIEAAQVEQQEDYQRRRAHAPRVLQLQPGEFVMERLAGANGKLNLAAEGPYRFIWYTDTTRTVCMLEDSEGRSWRSSAQRVQRFVQRSGQPSAAAKPAGAAPATAAEAAAVTHPRSPEGSPPREQVIVLSSSEGTPLQSPRAEPLPPPAAGAARQKRRRRPTAKQQQLQEEERFKATFLEAFAIPLEGDGAEQERPSKKRNQGAPQGRRQPLELGLRGSKAMSRMYHEDRARRNAAGAAARTIGLHSSPGQPAA